FFPIHMYSRFQFYAGREEFHTIIIEGIYVKYKCWNSFYFSFCYYLLFIVLLCFGFHWRSAGIISIYILNPYIIQNDSSFAAFYPVPDSLDFMSVGDICPPLPLSLFLAIQPSTCRGGGILAYFVEKIR
ncbi:hypothetical protein, partial [Hungatella hathewayi]